MEKPLPPPPRVELDQTLLRWFQQIPQLIPRIRTYRTICDPNSVNGNTTSRQNFTITGINANDIVTVNASLTIGLQLLNARVVAADTIQVAFINVTAGAIDQGSTTFNVVSIR